VAEEGADRDGAEAAAEDERERRQRHPGVAQQRLRCSVSTAPSAKGTMMLVWLITPELAQQSDHPQ